MTSLPPKQNAYSPFAYSPFAYSPFAYSPDPAYSSAQMRTLIAVSAFGGTASELISVDTWDNSGDFYVRVSGRNGAFDVDDQFHLEVTQYVGVCEGVTADLGPSTYAPVAGDYETLILTDYGRMDPADPLLDDLQARLAAFAPTVNGIIIDVGDATQYQTIAEANAQADTVLQCPYAKNLVARSIKDVIDAYWEVNPNLEYLVLVGNDDVLPFPRYADRAQLGNESNYKPPVFNTTASFASLTLGYALSQDAYGSSIELARNNTTLPIPDLAVGRLVETPADIINMLDVYPAADGGVLPAPASALVTGYDFLTDAAEAVQSELETGLPGAAIDSLITPASISPLDREGAAPHDAPWTADMLDDLLLGDRHDLIFLAGHFSAQGALAADFETHLWASDVADLTVDLENALVYSAGCHSGYNIVNEHGIPSVTREPDWAQAFAQKGATFIGGTGYQYGDTEFLEYSERLYLEFTNKLRCGTQPMSIGQALVEAKQAYLADTVAMRGIHEKSLLEATLFGLPMLKVGGFSQAGCPVEPASIVTTLESYSSVPPTPGEVLGLRYADVHVASNLTEHTVTLSSVVEGYDPIYATYFSGGDGSVTNPAEPALPLERRNVSVDNYVLRGPGFRGGSYEDRLGHIPLTGAATTESRGTHPPFLSEVFYPVQPWGVNYFDLLTDPGSGITWLHVTPTQFMSGEPRPWYGRFRLFHDMDFRLYYSAEIGDYNGNIPALAAAPAILKVLATSEVDGVHFQITVAGDPAAGIQEVWVTYTGIPCSGGGACWQSLDLTQSSSDSTQWEGILDLNGTPSGQIQYMAQAVNGVGLVSLATNLGQYYLADVDPGDPSTGGDPASPPALTGITPLSPPSEGAYSTELTFSAKLETLAAPPAPVAGQPLEFALGAQQRWATTDGDGVATVDMPLLARPGAHEVRVSFAGNPEYLRSSASSSLTINKQDTLLSLMLGPNPDSGEMQLSAELTDVSGRTLREKTVIFVFDDGIDPYAVAAITGVTSQAIVGAEDLPLGSFDVTAYFGHDAIPIPGQSPLDLTDDYYEWSTATSGYQEISTDQSTVTVNAEVRFDADFAAFRPDEVHTATWEWGDGGYDSCNTPGTEVCSLTQPDPPDPIGHATGWHTYTEPGVYTVRLMVADQSGVISVSEYRYVVVYDAASGFVTGGGWIDSPPGAYTPDPALTGKATFGFVSKYKKGATEPSGQTQFRFKAADLNFYSDSYEWLVVAGHKAMYKGVGTINEGGNYGFLLSAIDAELTSSTDVDRFRIKIWDRDNNDVVVYDNQMGDDEDAEPTTDIGGGSIVIHTKKAKK